MRLVVVLLVLAFALLANAAPRPGFAMYRGARGLCSEHIAGSSMHISWTTAATTDSPARVVAFYEQATGGKAQRGQRGESVLGEGGDDVISIYPAAKHAEFPHCETKPDAGEQTVILLSHAVR